MKILRAGIIDKKKLSDSSVHRAAVSLKPIHRNMRCVHK